MKSKITATKSGLIKVNHSRRYKMWSQKQNEAAHSRFPFWCDKTETKSVRQGYAGKSWEWKKC